MQEIWHPTENKINVRDYTQQFVKVRKGREGGGVAIFTHRKVKAVFLKEYDVDNLEAVWADVKVGNVRAVVGSVYIPPGDITALDLLDKVIHEILQVHKQLIIGMDANSRSLLWDESCIGVCEYQKSRKMGTKVEEILDKHCLTVHNTGAPTYNSGKYCSAPDITLSTGITRHGKVSWSVVDDELRTPHEGIMIQIGERARVKV